MPVEIWCADWIVTIDQGKRIFQSEVTKRVPLQFLVNDSHFVGRVKRKFPDTIAMATQFKKPLNIKIIYTKQLGSVNQIIEEDPWN